MTCYVSYLFYTLLVFLKDFVSFYIMCMCVLHHTHATRMSVDHIHAVPWKPEEDTGSPWNWTYKWMSAMRTKPQSSVIAASALHNRECSLQPSIVGIFSNSILKNISMKDISLQFLFYIIHAPCWCLHNSE